VISECLKKCPTQLVTCYRQEPSDMVFRDNSSPNWRKSDLCPVPPVIAINLSI
jgi:hypothetical protein